MVESFRPPFVTLIRGAGLRATRQRAAVLEAVGVSQHASAATVRGAVSATLPDVSHQAIYDCLADLTRAGLLRRIVVVDGGSALFETRTRDNHHHIVCRSCGLVVDVDCAIGSAPCLEASDTAGFVIDEAEVIYRGLCAPCAEAAPVVNPHVQLPKES